MPATRVSRTTTISLPPELYGQFEIMAKSKGMTKSELVRAALRHFQRDDREWQDLLAYGRKKARQAGIRTETDVENLIDEIRD